MLRKSLLGNDQKSDRNIPKELPFRVLGLLGVALFVLFAPAQVARFSPFLALLLAWQWFMLPGFVLSSILFEKISWIERIPIAFVLGIGVGTPYTLLAIFYRARLEHYLGMSVVTFALILLLYVLVRLYRNPAISQSVRPEAITDRINYGHIVLIIVLIIGAGALAFVSSQWPPGSDDMVGLAYFAEVLQMDQITGTEPFHGTGTPVTPRNELIVWGYQMVLINRVAGTDPAFTLLNNRPIFIVLSFLSFFVFLRQFFKNNHQALLILSLWCVYLLATTQEDGMGSNLVTRIIQDKFVGWFIVAPVMLVFMLWFLEYGGFRNMISLAVGAFGATLLHPVTLATILLLCSSFGVVYILFERTKQAFRRTMGVGIILALCLLVPIYQYVRYSSEMPLDLAGMRDAVEYGRLTMAVSRYRLWLLDNNRYILHPSIILQPVILLGYALTPFLIPTLRKSNISRLLFGVLLLLPVYLYFPPVAVLVGKFVTPYLLWRLAWPIPAMAVIVIGWTLWFISKKLADLIGKIYPRSSLAFYYFFSFACIVAATLILRPQIQAGYRFLLERYQYESVSTCSRARSALQYLDQQTQTETANILASRALNYCIPGYAPFANVIEFRGYGTANRMPEELVWDSLQRVADARYFSAAEQVDDLVLAMIERWDIDYVFVETERLELDFQIRQLAALFSPVYRDSDFAIFAIVRPVPHLAIIDGYAAIRQRDWVKAEEIFTREIQNNPQQGSAYLGLGMSYEGQGDLEQALQAYLLASQFAGDEPAVHSHLAGTYLLLQDTENAIASYRMAVTLAPDNAALHALLGFAYHVVRRDDLARASYADVAALSTIPGTAMYYTLLGDTLSSANWHAEAVENYRQAIAIDPTSLLYLKLAQSLAKMGDWQAAILADQQSIALDPWASAPHVHLGGIYRFQEQSGAAIQEFERAWQLNPLNASAATSLASIIEQESGTEAALARMQDLLLKNKLLPGPRWGLLSLYRSLGETDAALAELNILSTLLVDEPSVISAYGDIAREAEQYDEAEVYYDQVLLVSPDTPSAHIGISYLYGRTTEYGPQLGQYLLLERAFPTAAWPHYLIAPLYTRLGYPDIAMREIRWALSLEPDNASGYLLLGDMYDSRGQFDRAVEQYQLAISYQPDYVDAYLNLSAAYINLGQTEKAWAVLEMALDQVLEADTVRVALGDLALSERDYEAAQRYYEAALTLDASEIDAYVGLSRVFLLAGEPEASLDVLRAATQNVPEDFTAYDLLADLELIQGNHEAAMQWLQSGIQSDPQSPLGYLSLGDEYRRMGALGDAVASYQQALAVDDQNVSAYLKLAALYENYQDDATAEAIYRALLARVPYSNMGYLNLGNLYLKTGRMDDAESVYKEGLSIPPLSPDLYAALSNLYVARGDWDAAVAILESGQRELPDSSAMALNLAGIYLQVGDFENAQAVYESALATNRTVPGVYLGLAQLAQARGETEAARIWLEQSLAYSPRSVEACLNLANFYDAQEDAMDAEQYYRKALDLDPLNNDTHLALGQFYLREERFEEALQVFYQALLIPPNRAALYINIGNTYLAMGQLVDAEQWYRAAILLDEMDIAPYLSLSTLYQSRAEWGRALESLLNAKQVQSGNGFVGMALGGLYRKTGNYAAAELEFRRVCATEPLRTDCHLSLGDLYVFTGQVEAAIAEYQGAIRLAPTAVTAYLSMARTYSVTDQASRVTPAYADAIASSPYQSTALLAQAAYFASQRDWAEAEAAYQIARNSFPEDQEAARQLALFYRQRGDWEAARDVLEGLVGLPEVESATFVALGDLYAARAQWDTATDAYQKAIQKDPTILAAYTGLANIYLMQGQVEEVVRIYQDAAAAAPEDAQVYLALGDAYLARLNYAAAQAAYVRALSLSTSFNVSAFVKLDNLNLKMNLPGMDLALLEEYARSVPSASVYTTLAYRYQVRAEWQSALEWYQAAVALEPTNGAAWLSLGNYYRARQDLPAALSALEMAVQYAPTSASAWLALGAVQDALGMPDEALAAYQLAIEIDRSMASAYIAAANWYAVREQPDQAVEYLVQGLQAAPANASGYEALGNLYLSLGQVELAMDTFQSGLEVMPGAASLYLGQAGFMGDQLAEAQEAVYLAESLQNFAQVQFDRTIGSLPPDALGEGGVELQEAEALVAYAQANYDAVLATHVSMAQDFETAEAYYRQVLRLQPDNVFALIGLGDLYRDFDRLDEALAIYEQAVAMNPTSLAALTALGNVYLDQGQAEAALQVFEHASGYAYNNMGVFYGTVRAYGALAELDVSGAAYSIQYSQYWWVYYVAFFRQNNP